MLKVIQIGLLGKKWHIKQSVTFRKCSPTASKMLTSYYIITGIIYMILTPDICSSGNS